MSSENTQENPNRIAGYLTYPTRNEHLEPVAVQPRQPHNLQGLLRFAMEATKAEDAPGETTLGPMDEERRKFLEEALKSMSVDVIEVLKRSIKVLNDAEVIHSFQSGDPISNEVELAFEELIDFVGQIDTANDFYKVGGYAVFPICWGSQSEEIRAQACNLLAEVCQNNPYCQSRALECGLLNILISMAESETSAKVLGATVYALSCVIRECEAAATEFVAGGGCAVLANLLPTEHDNVCTKVAFLIRYLATNVPNAKAELLSQGVIRRMAERLRKGRTETTEHILSSLLAFIADLDPLVLSQCRDPDFGLKSSLERYLSDPALQGNTDFIEVREYATELLAQLFDDYTPEETCDER